MTNVLYNITGMYVSPLIDSAAGTYGVPQFVEKVENFSFEFESDTDELKTYGQISELLTIMIKGAGTLSIAHLNFPVLTALLGQSSDSSDNGGGTQFDFLSGGAGAGYFGVIAAFAALQGNALIGMPKCKLGNFPGMTVEQNAFRRSEIPLNFIAPSEIIRKNCRIRTDTTVQVIPTDASGFAGFFSGMFA